MGTLTPLVCTTDDGVRLAYEVEGLMRAPAIVFSSSLGTTRDLWTRQVPAFADRFHVIRYDTRGHGGSDAPTGDYSIERLGRDVLSIMDAASVDRAHLCGLSIGGLTALWLALNVPQRVRSVVLANTAARIGNLELWHDRIRHAREVGLEPLAEAAVGRWFTPAFRDRAPGVVGRFRATMAGTRVDGYVGCSSALRDTDLRSMAQQVRVPTLVIVGRHDVATPAADGVWLAEQVPGAQLVELDAAHLSNVECTEEFSRAVGTFWRARSIVMDDSSPSTPSAPDASQSGRTAGPWRRSR